jgi:hypothetical protein
MRRFHITFTVALLAIISWGAGYAYSRESFHNTDLPALYQRINTESFDGKLPRADVHWATLDDAYGQTETHEQWYIIEIDRETVQNDAKLLEVLRHEACHTLTMDKEDEEHGELWQACIQRFKQ